MELEWPAKSKVFTVWLFTAGQQGGPVWVGEEGEHGRGGRARCRAPTQPLALASLRGRGRWEVTRGRPGAEPSAQSARHEFQQCPALPPGWKAAGFPWRLCAQFARRAQGLVFLRVCLTQDTDRVCQEPSSSQLLTDAGRPAEPPSLPSRSPGAVPGSLPGGLGFPHGARVLGGAGPGVTHMGVGVRKGIHVQTPGLAAV